MSSSSSYKRKRYSDAAQILKLARAPTKAPKRRRTAFVQGRDRRGGYYGRYSGRDAELKFHDVNLDDAVVAGGGVVTPTVNIIPQGVTESERIGRKCTIKSINWRGTITLPEVDAAVTPGNTEYLRVILYLDKQCNGATAATTDLLESADIYSFRNLANSSRFTFLLDKLHVLNYQTLASDGAGVVSSAAVARQFTLYKKCDIPIEFSSTTGAIGEIRSNNIGVLLLCSSGTASFYSKFRLRFSDS